MNPTTEVMNATLDRPAALPEASAVWTTASKHLLILAQLIAAALVVFLYRIEGPAFQRLFALATAGFAVNLVLPLRYRLPFFAALSIAGTVLVFGITDAGWLIAAGGVLIGICHLPLPFRARVAALLAMATLLALARAGVVTAPWSAAVWPILGSMFMFRLVLYMLAVRAGQVGQGPWATVAYFFMLPNLVFPLFPVIDYQTFRRTHYDKDETGIYEQGMLWISRGLVHLVLYRFVYHSVLNDPVDVVGLGDLLQFMIGTFLLYLRVSGQFHLIVGVLHLFGFRLPETHRLYYLAHSYTDLWRRINIYWTDFMMKTVFYPTYFKVKKLGPSAALVISTTAVFVTTWVLHSYQWFWLRGGFPITIQDTLFWGVLGALVIRGALKELHAVRKPKTQQSGWDWRLGLKSVVTFFSFCFLWSLWSTESVGQWIWMLGAATNVDLKGFVILAVTFGIVWYLGGRDLDGKRSPGTALAAGLMKPSVRAGAALAVLVIASVPALQARAPRAVAEGLQSMRTTGLNVRDAALQHRGYYEQLEVRGAVAAQAADVMRRNGERWDNLATVGMIRDRNDLLQRDLIPSRSVDWNGNRFSTNSWGMRDREYGIDKPAGTLRIALLGPSHVMGNGVPDGATFEAILEERLNREFRSRGYGGVEILNFGVDGYSFVQQLAILQDRVLRFKPDVVIATHYHRNRSMTERYLQRLAWSDVQTPAELRELLESAGLSPMDRGTTPVPFAPARRLAKLVGIEPRMPAGEAATRTRWIADDVLAWSIARFAEVTRAAGAEPIVLGLNAVIDDIPPKVPNLEAIERARLPLIDLFDVFPDGERPALRVAPWDDHPNVAGHQLIADRLFSQLVPLLEPTVTRRGQSASALHPPSGGH